MTQAAGRAAGTEAQRLAKKTYFIFNAISLSLSCFSCSLSGSGATFPEQMIDKRQSPLAGVRGERSADDKR